VSLSDDLRWQSNGNIALFVADYIGSWTPICPLISAVPRGVHFPRCSV
jgi:hypothetical protein